MRNFGKFISKHLFIYLSVIILIVGFDLLLFFLTFNGTVNSISENNPVQTLEKVSNNLTIQDGKYILKNRCQKDLNIHYKTLPPFLRGISKIIPYSHGSKKMIYWY